MQGKEEEQSHGQSWTCSAQHAEKADDLPTTLCIEQALHMVLPESSEGPNSFPETATANNSLAGSGSHRTQQPQAFATAEQAASGGGPLVHVQVQYEWGNAKGITPAAALSKTSSALWQYSANIAEPVGAQEESQSMLQLEVPTQLCMLCMLCRACLAAN